MATTVLDGKMDRFLWAALAQRIQAPTRSRRNSHFSGDATGRTCPTAAIRCCGESGGEWQAARPPFPV